MLFHTCTTDLEGRFGFKAYGKALNAEHNIGQIRDKGGDLADTRVEFSPFYVHCSPILQITEFQIKILA